MSDLVERLKEARGRLAAFEPVWTTIPGLDEALCDYINAVADVLEEMNRRRLATAAKEG